MPYIFSCLTAAPVRMVPTEEIPVGIVVTELCLAVLLLAVMLIFPRRAMKILCACGAEVCLFLACRQFFGSESVITQIMCWFTAAVACLITVMLVNHINWGNLRGSRNT